MEEATKAEVADPDAEDVASDFFDDFTKDEFMEGLSVIDSWDECDANKDQLRTIMASSDAYKRSKAPQPNKKIMKRVSTPRSDNKHSKSPKGSHITDSLDDYIRPGSRRNPSKTNEAIKRDKEVKIKEYLAKHLESNSDLRPPGTELDDFFEEQKGVEIKHSPEQKTDRSSHFHQRSLSRASRERRPQESYNPRRQRRSPRRSPHNYQHYKSRRSPWRPSFRNQSPPRRQRNRYSPPNRRHSPRRSHYSRSPGRRYTSSHHSRSPVSYSRYSDNALGVNQQNYPQSTYVPMDNNYQTGAYSTPMGTEYNAAPAYPYPTAPSYMGHYPQPDMSAGLPIPVPPPQPVPAPSDMVSVSSMIPSQAMQSSTTTLCKTQSSNKTTPYDALAQLVAEGKLSKEDYLKLAPNKAAPSSMDTKTRLALLNRCLQAMSRLENLRLPNLLLVKNYVVGKEQKSIIPKYCSPLKRQAVVEFDFIKPSVSSIVQQNKQLIDSIISAMGLELVIDHPKLKVKKNVKDVAVQTSKPCCEVCEIREATKFFEAGTSTEPEHFSSSTYTQVVEEDLVNSKAIFNPSGSVGDSAPISIAHLTPAQLVSQLAARAKSLKHTTEPPHVPNQFGRRNFDNRPGGHNYQNYNYRY